MPRAHFTDITVRSLKPKLGHQLKFWDRSTPGFGVRVNQHGTKSWIVMYGEQRQLKVIGRYPDMPLAAARAEAKKMLAHRVHPTPTITFEDALPLFLSTHCAQYNKPSTAKETERVLRINFLPALRAKALEDISTHNISGIVDRLLSAPAAANHAFTAIRTFFRWATRRRYIPHSPCEGLRLPTRPNTKDRVLNDDEIVAVWRAAEDSGFPFGIPSAGHAKAWAEQLREGMSKLQNILEANETPAEASTFTVMLNLNALRPERMHPMREHPRCLHIVRISTSTRRCYRPYTRI